MWFAANGTFPWIKTQKSHEFRLKKTSSKQPPHVFGATVRTKQIRGFALRMQRQTRCHQNSPPRENIIVAWSGAPRSEFSLKTRLQQCSKERTATCTSDNVNSKVVHLKADQFEYFAKVIPTWYLILLTEELSGLTGFLTAMLSHCPRED